MVTSPASCFLSSSSSSSAPFIIQSRILNTPPPSSSTPITTNTQKNQNLQHPTLVLLKSTNKDDEIAELEAKLKQLKEEKEQQQQISNEVVSTAVAETTTEMNGDRSVASNMKNQVPLDEMLSESWKEDEVENSGGFGIVGSLVTLVALVIGFVILGQVPVGQEGLDKYSTAKPSTTIDLGDKNPASKGLDIN